MHNLREHPVREMESFGLLLFHVGKEVGAVLGGASVPVATHFHDIEFRHVNWRSEMLGMVRVVFPMKGDCVLLDGAKLFRGVAQGRFVIDDPRKRVELIDATDFALVMNFSALE